MSEYISIEKTAGALIVQLNRPRAINALTPDMIRAIGVALDDAEADESINLVLIEGMGDKGFCAGGDVRLVRKMILDGQQAEAFAFFKAEYGVNKRISSFPKPVVSLMHGFTMGGGVGVGSHARYRFGTSASKWAMPESAIGFFADVGVRMLLARAKPHRALMFLLRGDPHTAREAVDLNLCDYLFSPDKISALREDILRAADSAVAIDALDEIAQKYALSSNTGSSAPNSNTNFAADVHEKFLSQPANEVFAQLCDFDGLRRALGGAADADDLAKMIWSRCPTTHACSILSLAAAQKNDDMDIVFAQEFALSKFFAKRPDFVEGVRAVLVDKDHSPYWQRFDNADAQRTILSQIGAQLESKPV